MEKSKYKKKNNNINKLRIILFLSLLITLFLLVIAGNNEVLNASATDELKQSMQKFVTQSSDDLINKKNVVFYNERDNRDNLDIDDKIYKDLTKWEYLRSNYTVDARTAINEEILDIDEFMNADLSLNDENNGEYQVLIFHTHASELYADSTSIDEGIIGVGAELKRILETEYGIKTLHITESFDTVDGQIQILGAYERMEPYIRNVLEQNPTIEVVIDMHRDGVADDVKLVTEVNGKPTAKLMFVNGLSKKLNEDGELEDIENLENEYLEDNLAFSFNMQLNGKTMYGDLFRNIYVNAYRYSLHMKPKSLLVEVGAQTNTFEEAKNAMEPLANVIYETVK